MGFLTTIAAPIIKAAGDYLQKRDDSKLTDSDRFLMVETWYMRAISGDANAMCYLKHMGGLRGDGGPCGGELGNEKTTGFKTQPAKTYCEAMYQHASGVLAGTIPRSAPLPKRPDLSQQSGIDWGKILKNVSEVTGTAATLTGNPPRQSITGSATAGQWLVIGVVAVVGVFVVARLLK